MSSALYNSFKKFGYNGTGLNLNGGSTIKVALASSSYTPDIDSHDFFNDITNEVSATGYSAGGATLTNPTFTQDNTNDLAKFDGDDVSWSSSTITARYAIIYISTGNTATSTLIGYIDFGSNKVSDGGTFLISWSASGIFTLS